MPYFIGLIRSSLPESLAISRASGGVVFEWLMQKAFTRELVA
jgi:hypothetical protein